MTVAQQTPILSAVGNGATTVFPFGFKVAAAVDLPVKVNGVLQTLNADYTISGLGVDAGGNITFATAPGNGLSVTAIRQTVPQRLTDYQIDGDFLTSVVNPDQDSPVLMVQDILAQLERYIRVPDSELTASLDLPAAATRANKYLRFNSAGDVELADITASTTILSQSVIAAFYRPQSAAELAAGITPTNYFYDWGYFDRYGGDPTGVADSWSAIDKAVRQAAQGGWPARGGGGVYLCNSQLAIDTANGFIFEGVGMQRTTIRFPNAGTFLPILIQRTALAECNGMTVRDICIDANHGGQLSGGIVQFNGCTDFLCTRVKLLNADKVSGPSNGVDGLACSNGGGVIEPSGAFEYCYVEGAAKAAIYCASGSNGVRVAFNHLVDNGTTDYGVAVLIDDATNIQVIDNDIDGSGAQAVLITDTSGPTSDVLIARNKIRRAGQTAVLTTGSGIYAADTGTNGTRDIRIIDNDIEDSGTNTNDGSGIETLGITNLTIDGNHCRNNGRDGIQVSGGDHVRVLNNAVPGNARSATAPDGAGVRFRGTIVDLQFSGNDTSDDRATNQQDWGVVIESGANISAVNWGDNKLNDNLSGPILCSGELGSGTYRILSSLQTANATFTAMLTLTFANNTGIVWRASRVLGKKSDSTAITKFDKEIIMKRQGGTLSTVSGPTVIGTDSNAAAYSGLSWALVSPNASVQAGGAAATTVNWTAVNEIEIN